jgi:hypothetical protein
LIAPPPFDAGGVHDTVARAEPGVAVTFLGGPGTALGVTAFDSTEAGPSPAALVA